MKKSILMGFIMCFSFCYIAFATDMIAQKNNTMKIGFFDVTFENEIYKIDGKLYVPVRELAENLNIPVNWDETMGQAELLVDHKQVELAADTELKNEGIIPDEETAYQVGKIILEKYLGRPLEYETERGIYYLDTVYSELDNSWRISQMCDYKIGGGGGTGNYSPAVVLNKNTGEVILINTHSLFENSDPYDKANIITSE